MITPEVKPDKLVEIHATSKLDTHYAFAEVTPEDYKVLGIPEPMDMNVPSVNLLEWFDSYIQNGDVQHDARQAILERLALHPYIENDIATLYMGSDSWIRLGWDYPAIDTTANFQIQAHDLHGNKMQLLIPNLAGIERWAQYRGEYEKSRALGIEIIHDLEEAMVQKFLVHMIPFVCKSFEVEGIRINPKDVSPTRFQGLADYNKTRLPDDFTVSQEKTVMDVKGFFAEIEMQFQIA